MSDFEKEDGLFYKYVGYPNSKIPLLDDDLAIYLSITNYLMLLYLTVLRSFSRQKTKTSKIRTIAIYLIIFYSILS